MCSPIGKKMGPLSKSKTDLPSVRYGLQKTEVKGMKGTLLWWDDSYGFKTVTDFTLGGEVKSATLEIEIGPSVGEIWRYKKLKLKGRKGRFSGGMIPMASKL